MLDILEAQKNAGYPVEYVVSRLRGRSARLVKSWDPILFSERPEPPEWYGIARQDRPGDAVSAALRKELAWLYGQMHEGLRRIFAPVFVFFELKTIFSCIRYKAEKGMEDAMERDLSSSLLSSRLKRYMLHADNQAVAVTSLLDAFSPLLPWIGKKHEPISSAAHVREAESALTVLFLETACMESEHPGIRWFFSFIVDMRNLLSAYKHIRWAYTGEPGFIRGGSIRKATIAAIKDEHILMALIGKFAGRPVRGGTGLEGAILSRLYILSERSSRTGSAVPVVLDYIIKRYLEARNFALIFSSRDVERETLKKEMAV